jgi:hypothetical protein
MASTKYIQLLEGIKSALKKPVPEQEEDSVLQHNPVSTSAARAALVNLGNRKPAKTPATTVMATGGKRK